MFTCLIAAAAILRTLGTDPIRDEALVCAIIQVESGGNPHAVNRRENAVGVLQIRPILVRDVNRILGEERFTLDDRYDPGKSREMFWIYTEHYSSGASRETIARRWNGGPRGDKKKATKPYWYKVRALLK